MGGGVLKGFTAGSYLTKVKVMAVYFLRLGDRTVATDMETS